MKFQQASKCCKRVLQPTKFAFAKKKSLSLARNLAHVSLRKLLIVFSTKVNLVSLFNGPEVLFSGSD